MRPLVRSAMSGALSSAREHRKASERDAKEKQQQQNAGDLPSSTNPTANDKTDSKKKAPQSSLSSSKPKTSSGQIDDTKTRATDFARNSTSQPRRLNDIAQAPPELRVGARLTSKVGKVKTKASAANGVDGGEEEGEEGVVVGGVSAAQKRMMELEREKAIARYRALKAAREGGARIMAV